MKAYLFLAALLLLVVTTIAEDPQKFKVASSTLKMNEYGFGAVPLRVCG